MTAISLRARLGSEYEGSSSEACVTDSATGAKCHFAIARARAVRLADVTGDARDAFRGDLRVVDLLGFSNESAAELSLLYQAADVRAPALLRARLPRSVRAKVPRTIPIPSAPIYWDAASRQYHITFDEPVRFFQFAVAT